MKHVEAKGSFRKVGREVGEATREDILFMRDTLVPEMLAEAFGGDELAMRRDAREHLAATEAFWPEGADYARGLAEGAGLALDEALPIVFLEEMSLPLRRERCSTILLASPDGWLIGHQEDHRSMFRGRLALLDLRFDGQPRLASLTYPGTFPGMAASLNDAGLAMTANSLWPDPVPGAGKQAKHFLAALEPTVLGALSWICSGPHQLSDHFLVVGDDRFALSVEVSGHPSAEVGCEIRQIVETGPLEEGQVLAPFCHANSVLWLEPWASGRTPDPAHRGSAMRFRELRKLAVSPPDGPQALLARLMEKDGILNRDAALNRTGQPDSVTVASVVIRPGTREMWCATYGGEEKPRAFAL